MRFISDFFNGLRQWGGLAQNVGKLVSSKQSFLAYGGKQRQLCQHGIAIPWQDSGHLINDIRITL